MKYLLVALLLAVVAACQPIAGPRDPVCDEPFCSIPDYFAA